jgi:hypothetical protein
MADPVAYAQAQIDEWHSRIKAGGSARPSPTIEVAQRAGYARVVVECSGCRQSKRIAWEVINRAPETLLADLAGRLVCQRCGENRVLIPRDLSASSSCELNMRSAPLSLRFQLFERR